MALTAYKVAVAVATGTATSWGSGIATFLLASVGGTLIGVAAQVVGVRAATALRAG
jgi:NhaP-type Na+/H+ or K+/H+ antiporter